MCGRYVLLERAGQMRVQFRASRVVDSLEDDRPRYNVAPTQSVPVVVQRSADEERVIDSFRWGLVPHWADDPAIGSKMINARAETVAEKPSFREPFKSRRCVVPCSGFYEWDKVGATGALKQPYLFTLPELDQKDGNVWGFAGLWSSWRPKGAPKETEPLLTCSIITTTANSVVGQIHERMPVILDDVAVDLWLDPTITDRDLLQQLLQPYPDDLMRVYPVSKDVNKVTNGDSGLIEPILNSA